MFKKYNYLIVTCLLLLWNALFGQNIKKITYDESEEIMQVTITSNFLTTVTFNKALKTSSIYLYKKNGIEVYKSENLGKHILFVSPIENDKTLSFIEEDVVFSNHSEEYNDKLTTLDYLTGKIIFEATVSASQYEMSPNQKYILTRIPAFEKACPLKILSLETGSQLDLPAELNKRTGVTWLDNDRIVLVYQQQKQNPEYNKSEYVKRYKQVKELERNMKIIDHDFKKGLIAEEEAKRKKDAIQKRIVALENKKIETPPRKYIASASKFQIYNITTGQIEIEKTLYLPSKIEFQVSRPERSGGTVFTDGDNNIYIVGATVEPYQRCILKLNKNFQYSWHKIIPNNSRITKIEKRGKLHFEILVPNQKPYFIEKAPDNSPESEKAYNTNIKIPSWYNEIPKYTVDDFIEINRNSITFMPTNGDSNNE